jgi:glycosyltransferase involved in cell wall biosynthesis
VPEDAVVAIFCAKFLERKRPLDAVRAFAKANVPGSYLVMVGGGPLAASLKEEVARLGIGERVRFTGLVKYSRLAEFYAASDVLVFPSEHEPYGLPVNEAMICGIPAIVSDRVGAGHDLVEDGKTGFKYHRGDVDELAGLLERCLADRELLRTMGEAARRRMQGWSPRENADATIRGVEKALRRGGDEARTRLGDAGSRDTETRRLADGEMERPGRDAVDGRLGDGTVARSAVEVARH